jgi:hypothetical protein
VTVGRGGDGDAGMSWVDSSVDRGVNNGIGGGFESCGVGGLHWRMVLASGWRGPVAFAVALRISPRVLASTPPQRQGSRGKGGKGVGKKGGGGAPWTPRGSMRMAAWKQLGLGKVRYSTTIAIFHCRVCATVMSRIRQQEVCSYTGEVVDVVTVEHNINFIISNAKQAPWSERINFELSPIFHNLKSFVLFTSY